MLNAGVSALCGFLKDKNIQLMSACLKEMIIKWVGEQRALTTSN